MQKNKIVFFFSFIFMLFITAPTVISIIDNSVDDISFVFSTSEEEKENQTAEKIKLLLDQFKINEFVFLTKKNTLFLTHQNKDYAKPYLDMVFPPPEKF